MILANIAGSVVYHATPQQLSHDESTPSWIVSKTLFGRLPDVDTTLEGSLRVVSPSIMRSLPTRYRVAILEVIC